MFALVRTKTILIMKWKILMVMLTPLIIPLLFVALLIVLVLCFIAEKLPVKEDQVYYYQTSWEEG
jgi:hypothetical protein